MTAKKSPPMTGDNGGTRTRIFLDSEDHLLRLRGYVYALQMMAVDIEPDNEREALSAVASSAMEHVEAIDRVLRGEPAN